MKLVSELIESYQRRPEEQRQETIKQPRMLSENTAALVNQVFSELQAIFPAWRHAYPDTPTLDAAKRTWTLALFENQIRSVEQINTGLRKARKSGSPHIPSVGQFVTWCKPSAEDFGLSLDQVYSEITLRRGKYKGQNFEFSHPVIAQINTRVGFQLYQLNTEKFRLVIKQELAHWLQRLAAGEQLPEPRPALESNQSPAKCYADQIGYKPKSFSAKALIDRVSRIQAKGKTA